MASKDINRRFTVDLEISTGDAEKKVRATVGNLKTILNDLSKSSDKMKFFQELVDYLSQVDSELDRFKKKHGDGLFNQIFGGLDSTIRQDMEKIFGVTREQFTVLNELRAKFNELKGKDLSSKDIQTEIQSIEKSVKSLYDTLGRADEVKNVGFGPFKAGRLSKLENALNEIGVAFGDVQNKISMGFQFSDDGAVGMQSVASEIEQASGQISEAVKKAEEAVKKYDRLLKFFDKGVKSHLKPTKGKGIQTVTDLAAEFKQAHELSREYEKTGKTATDEYKESLAKAVYLASQLKNTMDYVSKHGNEEEQQFIANKSDQYQFLKRFIKSKESTYGNIVEYLKHERSIASDELASFTKKPKAANKKQKQTEVQIQQAVQEENKQTVESNKQVGLSYDELKKKVQKYIDLMSQISKLQKGSKERKLLEEKQQGYIDEIYAIKKLNDDEEGQVNDLFEQMEESDANATNITSKLCEVLGVEIKANADIASTATTSAFSETEQSADKASESVKQVGTHIVNTTEYIHGMTLAIKEVFDLLSKPMDTEFKVLMNGQEMDVRTGQHKGTSYKTTAEAFLANLTKDIDVDAHSHQGISADIDSADFNQAAIRQYHGLAKISAIIGPKDITTLELTKVKAEDAFMVLQKLREMAKDPLTPSATVEQINQMFKDINPSYENIAKKWNPAQFGDLAQYIFDVKQNAEQAITPLERLKNIIIAMGVKPENLSKYEELFKTFSVENAGSIFNEIMQKEGIQEDGKILQVENISTSSLTQATQNIQRHKEQLAQLRKESKKTYQEIRQEIDKYLNTGDTSFFKQFYATDDLQEVVLKMGDVANGLENIDTITNQIANDFGIDPSEFVVGVNQTETAVQEVSQGIDEAALKYHEFIALAENFTGIEYISEPDANKNIARLTELRNELIELGNQGKITKEQLDVIDSSFDKAKVHLTAMDHDAYNGSGKYDYTYAPELSRAEDKIQSLSDENHTLVREASELGSENARLREQNEILQKQLSQRATNITDGIGSQTGINVAAENQQLDLLIDKLVVVKNAIDLKTMAFSEEKEALDGIVPREIAKLRELEDYLKQLQEVIENLFKNITIPENVFEGLKIDLNDIEQKIDNIVGSIGEIDKFKSTNGISSDAKVDSENLNISLQPILETLQAIQGILKGFTGVDANSKGSIKYKEPVKQISDAERDIRKKAVQYTDLDSFIHKNVKALMAIGINSRQATQNLWRDANYNREDFHPVEMAMEDVASVIRNKVPENILDGWFRNADSNYKPRLEHVALTDTNVRNAALNAMWDNYKNYSGKDIGFKEFLYSDIPVYRGKNNEKYVNGDELLSFTFDRSVAENFGNHVLEAMIRPIDTIGSYQTTGENEVLVRRDQLEKTSEYQTWLSNMSSGMKESFVQAIQQSTKQIDMDDKKIDGGSYALETTLQTVKGVLDSILTAINNGDSFTQLSESLIGAVNELKNVASGISEQQKTDTSDVTAKIPDTVQHEQSSDFTSNVQSAEDNVTELGQVVQAASDSLESLHGQSLSDVANSAQKAADSVSELGDELQRTNNIEQQSDDIVSDASQINQEAQAHRENADAIKQEVAAQEKANNVQKTGFEIVKDYWRNRSGQSEVGVEGNAKNIVNNLLKQAFDDGPIHQLKFATILSGDPNDISRYTEEYKLYDQVLQLIGYHLGELQPKMLDGKQWGFSAQVIANSERVVSNMEEARNILFGISNDNGIEQQVAAEQKLADAAQETANAKQKQAEVSKEIVQEQEGTTHKKGKKWTAEKKAYKTQAEVDISALRKDAKDSIKNIGFDLTSDNLAPKQKAIADAYKNILVQLENYLDRIKKGEKVEIDSARSVINALKDKTDAYKEANKAEDKEKSKADKEAEARARKNATRVQYADQKVANETIRHDTLQKRSITDFADSSVVQSSFSTYEQSYKKLINLQNELKASDNITADQIAEFNAAKTACDNYAKSLEKIINSSDKMRDESDHTKPITDIMDGFDDSVESRRAVLEKFVRDTYAANAAIGDFGKGCNSLNYTVKNSDGSFSQMTASINQARDAVNAITRTTGDAKGEFTNFFDAIKGKSKQLFTYMVSMFGIEEIFQQVRQGIQYVREIDSALTELKKVTNETDATYDAFLQKMSKTGSVIGATVSDLTTMAAEWARLGYSLEEAGMLAESTAILLNVSEFEDATTASEALISTMQAFGYAAEDSQHVVDVLNEVGK